MWKCSFNMPHAQLMDYVMYIMDTSWMCNMGESAESCSSTVQLRNLPFLWMNSWKLRLTKTGRGRATERGNEEENGDWEVKCDKGSDETLLWGGCADKRMVGQSVCVRRWEREREKRDEEVNTSGVAGKIDEVRVKKRNCGGKVSGDCKQ